MEDEKQTANPEIDRDIRTDEAWKVNQKTVFDLFVRDLYSSFGNNRVHFDKAISDAQSYDNARQAFANLALANAVNNADAAAKQSLRHEAIAGDRIWNVDEQGYTVQSILQDEVFKDSISAVVVAAVANALAGEKEKTPA